MLGMQPFRWGPHIRPDDGRIDVCVLSARSLSDYLRVGWQVLIGHRRRSPNIRYYSAERSVVVDADRPLPVQGDGEILGETPVRVEVVPDAVAVVVPPTRLSRTQPASESQLVGV
jgi:diacylglycerol kinase (ATP)